MKAHSEGHSRAMIINARLLNSPLLKAIKAQVFSYLLHKGPHDGKEDVDLLHQGQALQTSSTSSLLNEGYCNSLSE